MAILVVEDSPTIAHMLKAVLAKGGFDDVYTVSSGEEALVFLNDNSSESRSVELILMDVLLPGINGLEVCRKLKGMKELATVPVIVVTAQHDEQTMAAAFDAGAWDFLGKPLNGPELLIRMKAIIAKKREIEERLEQARV